MLEQVLQLYPPAGSHLSPSVQNVHSLASIESDQMHCSLRQRAHLLKKVKGVYILPVLALTLLTLTRLALILLAFTLLALTLLALTLLHQVTGAYVYRFNYWYQSNQQCSAVPNFHLPYLGAVHQDEVPSHLHTSTHAESECLVKSQPSLPLQGS